MDVISQKPIHPSLKKKKQFNFHLRSNLKVKCRIICAKRDVPMAVFIHEALENLVKKYNYLLK